MSYTTPVQSVILGARQNAVIFAGRVGYATGLWLPYVVGGGVWGEGEADVQGIATLTADHSGFIVGFGTEYRMAPNWSIDANYTYISMDRQTYNFTPFGGLPVVHGFESHNFTIGANFRWGSWYR